MFRVMAVFVLVWSCSVHAVDKEDASELVLGYLDTLKHGEFDKSPVYFHAADLLDLQRAFVKLAGNDQERTAIEDATPEEAFSIVLRKVMFRLSESELQATYGDVDIIGQVPEGDSMWHVVYRQRGDMRGVSVSVVGLMTASRQGNIWRLSLPSDIQAAVQVLNNQ